MTANQHLKLYDFFKQQFNVDEAKARIFAQEIENIVEEKFEAEKQNLASKSELVDLKYEVQLLRQEMKTGFAEIESRMKSEFNRQLIWLVGVMFALSGIIITVIKLLF